MGGYVNPFGKTSSAPTTGTPSARYQSPFTAKPAVQSSNAQSSTATPKPSAPVASSIPASALKGSLGGGYGTSNVKDSYSGKPLLTYENKNTQSSQLLANRTAPNFDPTIPQKIDPSVLHNGRMPEAASEAVRKATGAEPDENLDHLISLEAGGSNDASNLNLEKLNSSGTQPSLVLENQTAKDVASGKISYIQGQINLARAKGLRLPDDPDFDSAPHPLAANYPKSNDTQAKPPAPSFLDNISTFIKGVISNPNKSSLPLFNELGGNAVVHPIQTLNKIVDQARQGADATFSNLSQAAAQVIANGQEASKNSNGNIASTDYSNPKNLGDIVNLITAAASALFFPVAETFNIASQLPIIKPAADVAGLTFSKSGELTKFVGGKILDNFVSNGYMTQSTASILRTPIENVSTLIGQITLGAYIYGKVGEVMEVNGGVTAPEAKTIADDAASKAQVIEEAPLPKGAMEAPDKTTDIKAPISKLPSFAPEEAKNLEAQSKSADTGTINLSGKTPGEVISEAPKFNDIIAPKSSVEEKTTPQSEIVTPPKQSKVITLEVPKSSESEIVKPKVSFAKQLKPIEGTREVKERGLSKGVIEKAASNTPSRLPDFSPDEAKIFEQKQIASKLTDIFGELPQYKKMDVADQGAKATDLFEKDPEAAKSIAYGEKAPPKGLTPEAVFVVVEQDAIERNDVQTLKELANSRLTQEATTMGQRIRMLGERNPDAPTDAIRQIQESRIEAAKKPIAEEVTKGEESIKKATRDRISGRTKVSWDSLVESMTC